MFSAQLKLVEVDLESARKHLAQFQEISQASEAALASLGSTHEEYKASTEAALAKRAVRPSSVLVCLCTSNHSSSLCDICRATKPPSRRILRLSSSLRMGRRYGGCETCG